MWYIHEELGNCQYISVCIVPLYYNAVFFSSNNIFMFKKKKTTNSQHSLLLLVIFIMTLPIRVYRTRSAKKYNCK